MNLVAFNISHTLGEQSMIVAALTKGVMDDYAAYSLFIAADVAGLLTPGDLAQRAMANGHKCRRDRALALFPNLETIFRLDPKASYRD